MLLLPDVVHAVLVLVKRRPELLDAIVSRVRHVHHARCRNGHAVHRQVEIAGGRPSRSERRDVRASRIEDLQAMIGGVNDVDASSVPDLDTGRPIELAVVGAQRTQLP